MGNAFATIISAELLSSEEGIGYLLAVSQLFLETDVTFVVVVSLGIMGFATDRLFRFFTLHFGGEYIR
jgi:NitT/TauT family transport system permease protein